ncbi:helix-turn-helix transcriptional regulator [Desertivirga arenae]|uniref:helix-turn-helix transcriptional regulator n=1 Tax=Desertivirga arenae TaxID=2810309 RepID=UPI001A967A32|nr:AraC family transcriptional regulator [Pedobacter sp. SYSU D00823]
MRIEIKIADYSHQLPEHYKQTINAVSVYENAHASLYSKVLKTEEVDFDDKHILIAGFEPGSTASLILEKHAQCSGILFILRGKAEIYTANIRIGSLENQYMVLPRTPLSLLMEADGPLKLVALSFDERIVAELMEDLDDGLLKSLPITPSLGSVLDSIIRCGHTGYSRRIFYEAKMLELLLLISNETKRRKQNSFISIKTYDLNKIYQAKDFIERNIQSPCSLIELAHKVGLNDFKLKKGFKEVIGTTVFGYLYDFRMEKARILLENGAPVNEVSYEVGYKNPHHFTAAFKKKYGVLPSSLKRQNKQSD